MLMIDKRLHANPLFRACTCRRVRGLEGGSCNLKKTPICALNVGQECRKCFEVSDETNGRRGAAEVRGKVNRYFGGQAEKGGRRRWTPVRDRHTTTERTEDSRSLLLALRVRLISTTHTPTSRFTKALMHADLLI